MSNPHRALLPILLLSGFALAACGGASQAQAPDRPPCPPCTDPPLPASEVSAEQVQAILEQGGLDVERVGKQGASGPRLLVVQDDPKVVLSVNPKRGDIEMAVVYSVRTALDPALLLRLNVLNQKMPCQASVSEDGKLLVEGYYPFGDGLHAASLLAAVRKFRKYGMVCALQLKDVLE